MAFTAPFERPGNSIAGSFRLRLIGPGSVLIAIRSLQSDRYEGEYLGGYSITNYEPRDSGVGYEGGSTLKSAIDDNSWVAWANPGTGIKNYTTQGQVIQLNWSIEQQQRTLFLGADGSQASTTYSPVGPGGVSNSPLKRLLISVFVSDFQSNSELLFDEIRVEESK